MELSKKKEKWVKQFKPTHIVGKPLPTPAPIQERYEKAILALVRKMTKETEREIAKLYKTPEAKAYFAADASIASQARILVNALTKKFESLFAQMSGKLAEQMVTSAEKSSAANAKQSLKDLAGGLAIDTSIKSADMKETIKASIAQNAQLIKSIPQEYLLKVGGDVMRSVTSGEGVKELMPKIQKYGGMTERRAKNIALDQTRKAYNSINADRMKKAGIKKFRWRHSHGGLNPRADHLDMDGNIYSFDDLPVINPRTGERGLPGQAPNCKCFMEPIIEFDDE